jgi:hypothetical protein
MEQLFGIKPSLPACGLGCIVHNFSDTVVTTQKDVRYCWMEIFDPIVLTAFAHYPFDDRSQRSEIHSMISLPSRSSHVVTRT